MSVPAFNLTALAASGLFMSLSCIALAGDASQTDPEQPLPPALADCVKLTRDTLRLACFDREVAKLIVNGGTADKESHAAGAASAPALTPEQKLGLSKQSIEKLESSAGHAPEPTELHAHIAHVSSDGLGHMLFVLDNAQVWRQADADFNFIARSGDAATISPGAMGSYWLSVNAHSGIKVKRLQ
jgi:hypothetical protein